MRGAVLVRAVGIRAKATPSSPELIGRAPTTVRAPRPRAAAIAPRRRRLHPGHHRHRARIGRGRGDLRSNSVSRIDRHLAAACSLSPLRSRPRFCCSKSRSPPACCALGRRLEIRLRLAFLEKIPRLGDRYFQSRLKSDMAERSHSIHLIRRLPELGGQLLRYSFEIVFTTAGIIWIDPAARPSRCSPRSPPSRFRSRRNLCLMERDLRLRTHAGALTHFYLDALLGLVAIHTHGGQPAVRREHESLLTEWARAGLNLQRAVLSLETLQFLAGFGLAIWLLASHLGRGGRSRRGVAAGLLGAESAGARPGSRDHCVAVSFVSQRHAAIAGAARAHWNSERRALSPTTELAQPCRSTFENVSVVAAGHQILRDINLSIPAGSHVAIVGASGAGKSSLVGLLLGWHRAGIRQRVRRWRRNWTIRVSINCARTSRGWIRRCNSGTGRWPKICATASAEDAAIDERHRRRRVAARHRAASQRSANSARRRRRIGLGRRRPARAPGPRAASSRRAPGDSRRAVSRARFRAAAQVAGALARNLARCHAARHLARHRGGHDLRARAGAGRRTNRRRRRSPARNRRSRFTPCSKPSARSAKNSGTERSGVTCV